MIGLMMTTVQARVDSELKQRADRVFQLIGLDSSAAIRMFLAAVVNANGLPFQARFKPVVIDGMALDISEAELKEAIDDAILGRNLSEPFATAEEAIQAALEGSDE